MRSSGREGFLPHLDEFYFTTGEKKLLGNCRSIAPSSVYGASFSVTFFTISSDLLYSASNKYL